MHCHFIKLNKKNYNFCESKEYREEKETKKIRGGCEGEHERWKNDEREGKILFIPRTQGTYIELYRLSRVIKIPTRDIYLLGCLTHYHP